MSPIDPIRRHTSPSMITEKIVEMERTAERFAHEAAEAADKALDVVLEEAGALTFFGLTRISDSAARKFVEIGLRTRGHVGYPSTLGKKVAFYGLLGALGGWLCYRLGALDGFVRRSLQKVLDRATQGCFEVTCHLGRSHTSQITWVSRTTHPPLETLKRDEHRARVVVGHPLLDQLGRFLRALQMTTL